MKQLFLFCCILLQYTMNAQTYYDTDNNKINKAAFDKLLLDKQYYYVENDSLKDFKLMNRDQRGEFGSLGDSENLFKELNEKLNLKLDSSKPLIIYYYPGKDPCNSGGMYPIKREYLKSSKQLVKKVRKIADVNVIRIYKNNEGLSTLSELGWQKDPNALIENLFFNYHYGCESFVIINKNKYAAGFGEYPHENVIESLKELVKSSNEF